LAIFQLTSNDLNQFLHKIIRRNGLEGSLDLHKNKSTNKNNSGDRVRFGNLRPLINVGCRTQLANADFEKLAAAFFLIFAPRPGVGVVGEGVFSNDFENIPPFSKY
jgi:hypothetical protein